MKGFINRIIKITAAAAVMLGMTIIPFDAALSLAVNASAENAASKNTDKYKKLYKDFLNEKADGKTNSGSTFDLYDIDSDGIPELFISNEVSRTVKTDIYTVENDTVVLLSKKGVCKNVSVSGKYLASADVKKGKISIDIYEKSGASLKKKISLRDDKNNRSNSYFVNDESVSENEYVKSYSKYNNMTWFSVGGKYSFTRKDINEAFKINDHNSEHKKLNDRKNKVKKEIYNAFRKDFEDKEVYGILWEDINNDGMKELVASCADFVLVRVYYYTDKGVKSLNVSCIPLRGFVKDIRDKNQILYKSYDNYNYGSYGGVGEYTLYEWNGKDYTAVIRIDRVEGYYDDVTNEAFYGQAYINGKKVSNEKFEVKLKALNSLADKYNDFDLVIRFDDNNKETAAYKKIMNDLTRTKGLICGEDFIY